jgi:hypothetical protein
VDQSPVKRRVNLGVRERIMRTVEKLVSWILGFEAGEHGRRTLVEGQWPR